MTTTTQADRPDTGNSVALAMEAYKGAEKAYDKGDFKSAEELLGLALSHIPEHPELLVKRGYTRLQLGHSQGARDDLATVIRMPSDQMPVAIYRSAIAGIIYAFFATGEHHKVAGLLVQNLASMEDRPALLDLGALSLIYTGNFDDVPAVASKILSGNRLHGRMDLIASALAKCGKQEQGFGMLKSMVQITPDHGGTIKHFVRAVAECGYGDDTESAFRQCQRANCLAEAPVYAHYQLARYYDMTERFGVFEKKPEIDIVHERTAMDPALTGLSRFEFKPERMAAAGEIADTPAIDPQTLVGSVARLRRAVAEWKADGAFNAQLTNIGAMRDAYAPDAADPVQVVSSGRCGTRAFFQYCSKHDNLAPLHSFELGLLACDRNHLLYRLLTSALDRDSLFELVRQYLQNRTADLMWAYRHNLTPVFIGHWDSIFAPVIAELFPSSRFIHLTRDPSAVFRSIYGKNQWQWAQLMPMRFDPTFSGGRFVAQTDENLEIEECVAWYLHVTSCLAQAIAAGLEPERWLALKSETLFAAEPETLDALCGVVPLAPDNYKSFKTHFSTPRNTKEERADFRPEDLDRRSARIPQILDKLEEHGHL